MRSDTARASGTGEHERSIDRPTGQFAGGGSNNTLQSVAICTVGELFGGVERHVLGVLDGLHKAGIGTLLILFHDGELAVQARVQGAEVVVLPNRNLSLWSTARALARVFEWRGIDLVHVHGYKAAVFCSLARRWYPLPVVKTEHGLPEPTGRNPVRALRNRVYYFSDRTATRLTCSAVCYVTKDLLAHYRQAHRGLRTVVIPNGIAGMDRNDFPRPPEFAPESFNLVIVGRLDRVKGIEFAIDALGTAALPKDVRLNIVGAGPSDTDLRALTEARGLGRQVQFLGFRRNVYDYLAHCDALLMPSLHEGLPYTLLEAMALGVPILASRVGGLAEVLQDEVTALLVAPRDANAIAQAIRRLYDDQQTRQSLGRECRRLHEAKYSLKAMIHSYLGLYRAVLTPNGPTAQRVSRADR